MVEEEEEQEAKQEEQHDQKLEQVQEIEESNMVQPQDQVQEEPYNNVINDFWILWVQLII
jgi:hypothetical protein